MSRTCAAEDCQSPGYCDGRRCERSGRIRPYVGPGDEFVCAYPECDCAVGFPAGHRPGPASCPHPDNPHPDSVPPPDWEPWDVV